MDVSAVNEMLDEYARWYRGMFTATQQQGCIRITCPVVDRHNDNMSVYIAQDGDSYVLTDMGSTIDDLSACGCDVGSKGRKGKLLQTLAGYGLSETDGEIYTRASKPELFQRLNMMMQGMETVDDLFFTVRDGSWTLFTDEVAGWLDNNGIRYTENLQLVGKSGLQMRFDFVIPASSGRAPERLIKAVNSPSVESVKSALFGWNDIRESRKPGTMGYLFLNAPNTRSGRIDQTVKDACTAYHCEPVAWGDISSDVFSSLVA